MNNDLISREYVESIVKAEFVDLQDGTEEWRTYVNDTCENILNKVDNAPTVCGNNPKWCESCVSKGKCASTRPHIIDNCDMNVFEPEKYIEGGAE